MAEQGLKAVVYPELDEVGMREFVRQLSEELSGTTINVGTTVMGSQTSDAQSSGNGSMAGDVTRGTAVELSKESVKTIAEGHKQGEKDVSEDDAINEGKNKSVLASLGGIMGTVGTVATAVGVGAVGVAGATVGIYKFLEASSEPLRNVTSLFTQAFNLIWMPVGTILAVQLMPVLRDVMGKIADWMSRAWVIYDMEGWSGLIKGALDLSFDVLLTLITDALPVFGDILGTIFWEIFKLSPFGMLLQHFFGDDFWDSFPEVVKNIQSAVDMITTIGTLVWDVFKETTVYTWIEKIYGFIEDIWDSLTFDKFKNIADIPSNIGQSIGNGTFMETAISTAKSLPVVGPVLSAFGLADGGIATSPTWRLFGEAGPEAVIPLNQMGDVMNDIYGDSKSANTPIIEEILGYVSEILSALNTGSTLLNEVRDVLDDRTYADGIFGILSVLNRTDVVVNGIHDILAERSQNETWPNSNISFNQLREVSNGLTGQGFERGNTNNITINIKGGNATEVGEEVQRVLEKTVGKASSKMMWW